MYQVAGDRCQCGPTYGILQTQMISVVGGTQKDIIEGNLIQLYNSAIIYGCK